MKEFEKIRHWKKIKDMLGGIYDYKTRQMYHNALLARAISEYGFNPENPGYDQKNVPNVDLDDWEQQFVEDIKDSITFGFNVRKLKSTQEYTQMRRNMRRFVLDGGMLADIPEDIRTPNIINAYLEELLFEGDGLLELADSVL